MDEYIRREDAIKCIEGQCVDGKMWGNDESEGTLIDAYSAIDDLMEIPPADVATVLHGRWVRIGIKGRKGLPIYPCCSVCGIVSAAFRSEWEGLRGPWKFCPNCGAKMDG